MSTDSPKRIAFIHYHLRGGGMSRVLEHQQNLLPGNGADSVVITGEEPLPSVTVGKFRVVEGLGYGEKVPQAEPEKLLQQILEVASEALGGEPDLWHVHNSALGKNRTVPDIVNLLAASGRKLLLQLHDFAEDGRPGNYAKLRGWFGGNPGDISAAIYPQAGNIHYGLINRRDWELMSEAGVERSRLHALSNPVHFDLEGFAAAKPAEQNWERLILYPTRAIGRKNLGEVLLWAAACRDGSAFGITLAPKNPLERAGYVQWVRLAEELSLPVEFELADLYGYFPLLKTADWLLTTSIAEGFGLAFLEPLLLRKPLCGRALPEITGEFSASGVDLDFLYRRLDVPLAWVGEDVFRERLAAGLEKSLGSYGVEMTDAHFERAFGAAVKGDGVDFGCLDARMQERVVRGVASGEFPADELAPAKLLAENAGAKAEENAAAVRQNFSLERYGQNLLEIYRRVIASTSCDKPPLDAEKLLAGFLAAERFRLLRK